MPVRIVLFSLLISMGVSYGQEMTRDECQKFMSDSANRTIYVGAKGVSLAKQLEGEVRAF
jgi:hypothetical protein